MWEVARAVTLVASLLSLSGCVGVVYALSAVASASTILKNECGVTLTTAVKGQSPECFVAKPTPGSKRWDR